MHTSTLDLLGEHPRIRSVFPRKTVVYTKPGTLINEIAGDDPLEVNAIHSQAVASTGPALKTTAYEKVGIKQVIEGKGHEKLLGVQWHPEYLLYMKAHRNIFAWVIEEAAQ